MSPGFEMNLACRLIAPYIYIELWLEKLIERLEKEVKFFFEDLIVFLYTYFLFTFCLF